MKLLVLLAISAVCVSGELGGLVRHKRGWGSSPPPQPPPQQPPRISTGWYMPPQDNGWGPPPQPQPPASSSWGGWGSGGSGGWGSGSSGGWNGGGSSSSGGGGGWGWQPPRNNGWGRR